MPPKRSPEEEDFFKRNNLPKPDLGDGFTLVAPEGYFFREMGAISDPKETVTVFQTDAPINGGTSGGGVYDLQGRLQGMVTRKYLGASGSDTQLEGIAMCIPILQITAFLNAH